MSISSQIAYFSAVNTWINKPPVLAAIAYVLLTLSWPPDGFFPLIFLAFVPIWKLYAGNVRGKFWWTYLIFAAWNASTTYWIVNAHWSGALATTFVNGVLMALAVHKGWQWSTHYKGVWKWLVIFGTWTGVELLHDWWSVAFPWLNLGNVFQAAPWAVQWYAWTGPAGGTLLVLGINAVVYTWMRSGQIPVRPLAVATLPFLVSLLLYWLPAEEDNGHVTVAVVQPNIDPYGDKFNLSEVVHWEKVMGIVQGKLDGVDLLVLPETFMSDYKRMAHLERYKGVERVRAFADSTGIGVLTGTSLVDFNAPKSPRSRMAGDKHYSIYNSAMYIGPRAQTLPIYHKGKLVVGAEEMPFVNALKPIFGDFALDFGGIAGSLDISHERKVLTPWNVAPVICWENEFSGYCTQYTRKGAQMIAVITNDGWWGDTDGHVQHMHLTSLRAIENNRWAIRSANTGISTVITNKGKVLGQLAWDTAGVIVHDIPLKTAMTLYARTGNIMGKGLGLLTLLLVLAIPLSKKTRSK